MNGKQARLLRKLRADKKAKKRWATLSSDVKGVIRKHEENNPKM